MLRILLALLPGWLLKLLGLRRVQVPFGKARIQ